MISFFINNEVDLITFYLIFTRWVILIGHFPLLDGGNVSVTLRILLSFIISFGFYPSLQPTVSKDVMYWGRDNFIFLIMYYSITSIFLGLLVQLILQTLSSSGSIIAQNIGIGSASYFDPNFKQNVGPLEKLILYAGIVLLIDKGVYHPLFKGVYLSFSNLSTQIFLRSDWHFQFLSGLFKAGILLSTPIIFLNLVMTSVMGIMAKLIPQLNILMIHFVVNIGIGLFIFTLLSSEFFDKFIDLYVSKLALWYSLVS